MRRMFHFHKTPAAGEALGQDPNLSLGDQHPSLPGGSLKIPNPPCDFGRLLALPTRP